MYNIFRLLAKQNLQHEQKKEQKLKEIMLKKENINEINPLMHGRIFRPIMHGHMLKMVSKELSTGTYATIEFLDFFFEGARPNIGLEI